MPKGIPPEHSKFKVGQSGNPNGRPKKLPEIDMILFEEVGEIGFREIIKSLYKEAKKGNIRAAEILLDRGYGKAKQSIDLSHKELTPITGMRIIDAEVA